MQIHKLGYKFLSSLTLVFCALLQDWLAQKSSFSQDHLYHLQLRKCIHIRRCAKSRIIIQSTIHGREAIMSGSRASLQCRQHTHWESSAAMNIADDLINIWILSFLHFFYYQRCVNEAECKR